LLYPHPFLFHIKDVSSARKIIIESTPFNKCCSQLFSFVRVAIQKLFAQKLLYFGAKNIGEIKLSQFNKKVEPSEGGEDS